MKILDRRYEWLLLAARFALLACIASDKARGDQAHDHMAHSDRCMLEADICLLDGAK